MNNNNDRLYYSRIEKIVKYKALGDIQDTIDSCKKINDYIVTLPIDRRKEATGNDIVTWFFDVYSKEDSAWNNSFVSEFQAAYSEMLFLAAKPTKTLFSNPAFNYSLAKLMNGKTQLTMLNNYQLDYLEHCLAGDGVTWDYDTKTMQDVENDDLGSFDFVFITIYDIFHDISLVEKFCNSLNSGGTMVVSYANDDLRLYTAESEYTPTYEMHQIIKAIPNVSVYHNPTVTGHIVVIKD